VLFSILLTLLDDGDHRRFAQQAQLKIKAKETGTPVNVVQSFKKDFAGGVAKRWKDRSPDSLA